MRAIWKGAVAFGLVNVPVKLYAATGEHSVPLNQVHTEDGGRIRYRKVCSVCGEEVRTEDISKGYTTDDGQMVVLTDEDLDALPLSTEREISVEEFVPADQVDPIMLARTYYLEPERTAAKPYALLREALRQTDRMAVVKVALRQRESMAVLRVRDDVICLQTLLWPDEVRSADFPILEADIEVRPQELTMASSLVESLAGDFDPSQFEDSYQQALEAVIEAKVTTGRTLQPEPGQDDERVEGGEVVDLLSALQRSVERARGRREGAQATESEDEAATGTEGGSSRGSSRSSTARSGTARSGAARTGTATSGAAKTRTAKGSTAKASTAKSSTAKTGTAKTSTAKTSTAKSSTAKPSTARAGSAKTSTAKTSTAKSGTAKPAAAKTGTRASAAKTGTTDAAKKTTTRKRAS